MRKDKQGFVRDKNGFFGGSMGRKRGVRWMVRDRSYGEELLDYFE